MVFLMETVQNNILWVVVEGSLSFMPCHLRSVANVSSNIQSICNQAALRGFPQHYFTKLGNVIVFGGVEVVPKHLCTPRKHLQNIHLMAIFNLPPFRNKGLIRPS